MKYYLTIILSILTFTSCNFENYITIHYSDIIDFLADAKKDKITLPIRVKVEVSGMESCEKEKGEILNLLSPYFINS